MADYAPNYTGRYKVRYSSLGKTHTQMWRLARGEHDPTALAVLVGEYLAAIEAILFSDFLILDASFALADSVIFLPADPPANPSGGVSTGGAEGSDAAVAISWNGRSDNGGKARFFQYGTSAGALIRTTAVADYRLTVTENASILAGHNTLVGATPPPVANDNGIVTWYPYVDVKANDRWVRKLRRG